MRLLIDEQTLRDLEILDGRDGRPSLFKMLDSAKTRGGAAALRRRIATPYADVLSIEAVQKAIRTILANKDLFSRIPGQFAVSGFEHYFHHRVGASVVGGRWAMLFDAFMLRVDSPHDYSRIVLGVGHAAHILGWFREVVDRCKADASGSALNGMLSEVKEILGQDTVVKISTSGSARAFWNILSTVAAIRGDHRDGFLRLITVLFEIDALVSMAGATEKYGFILPEVRDGPTHIEGTDLFHPFMTEGVRNPLSLDQGHRFVLVTGPNMAGKTTYLRTCGTVVYLAHLGMSVPGERLVCSPCQAFYTGIALSDDLRAGVSFFQAEALRAKVIAVALSKDLRVFSILDEPFKGTNVKDALDASRAFFSRLAVREGSLFLVSSHLIEAAPELMKLGTVTCKRFEAVEEGPFLPSTTNLRKEYHHNASGCEYWKSTVFLHYSMPTPSNSCSLRSYSCRLTLRRTTWRWSG